LPNNRKSPFLGGANIEVNGINYELAKDGYDDCFAINATGRLLVMESLDYSKLMFELPDFDFLGEHIHGVEPNTIEPMTELPPYYQGEYPPSSIMVGEHVKWDVKYWLHFASSRELELYYNKEDGNSKYDYLFEGYE
jgi:hypothetical protein